MRAALIVLFVSGFTGLNLKCASIPVSEKIIRQEAVNTDAKELVKRSNLSPDEKTFVSKALDDSLHYARDENKRAQKADAEIDNLKPYRRIVWGAGAAIGAALLFYAWRKFF